MAAPSSSSRSIAATASPEPFKLAIKTTSPETKPKPDHQLTAAALGAVLCPSPPWLQPDETCCPSQAHLHLRPHRNHVMTTASTFFIFMPPPCSCSRCSPCPPDTIMQTPSSPSPADHRSYGHCRLRSKLLFHHASSRSTAVSATNEASSGHHARTPKDAKPAPPPSLHSVPVPPGRSRFCSRRPLPIPMAATIFSGASPPLISVYPALKCYPCCAPMSAPKTMRVTASVIFFTSVSFATASRCFTLHSPRKPCHCQQSEQHPPATMHNACDRCFTTTAN